MKKILSILLLLLGVITYPIKVNAASGTLSVNASSTTVIVGNTVTVTITLSSSTALGSWEFDVNYDPSFLKLTSSNAESSNGTYFVNAGNGSTKTKSYTLQFRALKSGSTNITIGSYDVYAFDKSSMSISKSNKKLNLMTQAELEATYSKDNNLKDLTVEGYELDKPFDKDTTEYTVNVPTGTTSVKINAVKNDNTATINGDGEMTVTEGLNTLPIVVTAQNGDEKTYNLIVNVEDQNPIQVKVDNKNYIVIKNGTLLTPPSTFEETVVTINDFDIPAFLNTAAKITVVGLKDEEGNISLFTYDNGKYAKYNEMELKNYLLIPVAFDYELPYDKTTILINDTKIEAYKYRDNSDYVIINAKNLEDGQKDLYLYDTKENSLIRFDEEYMTEINETIKNYTYIIFTFIAVLVIMFIIILSLLHSVKKKQRKISKFLDKQEAKMASTRKLNDVLDEVKRITDEENNKNKDSMNSENINTTTKKDNLEGLTTLMSNLSQEVEKELESVNPNLSKKELKKIEKQKAKDARKEWNKESDVSITELKINNKDDDDEVYDIFGDD